MWTDYSIRYIKNNKTSSISLAGISFVSSAFLALLCSMAYNMWIDHVNQIMVQEGSYTSRPEPLAAAYGFVIAAACLSLIIMIHNAFEIPMNSRIHQLGILQSVGATPKQIRSFLLQEVMILCAIPIVLGIGVGIGSSFLLVQTAVFVTDEIRTYEVTFQFHIMVVLLSLFASGLTVLLSAWIPARRISRLTPLTALSYGTELSVPKMKRFSLFSRFFGIHGELARKSIYARRKELRTSTLSLTFAFLALIGLLNIEAISGISTQFTYFERFRDKWDMTLTTASDSGELLQQLKSMEGIKSCIAYKKAVADTCISDQVFSKELQETGVHNLNEQFVPNNENLYPFSVPIYILDDDSFGAYCKDNRLEQNGIAAINTIWDSIHSSRKYREYIPLVDQEKPLTVDVAGNQFTITDFAKEMPMIKEEYKQYSLSLILSESFYEKVRETLQTDETTYNIYLTSMDMDKKVQEQIHNNLPENSTYTLESRMEEEKSEFKMRNGLKIFVCCFAGFLALIGIVNIFSFTLGQIYQRKKEFARYFSVGLSPKGMRKILTLEAMVISVRPFLLGVLISLPFVAWALQASEIAVSEYIQKAPVLITGLFTLAIFLFIMLAYCIGGKKVCNSDFVEVIKDETML
ncbi:MAG: ABC transporter permease [Lachnospiraceae bacterium]|nr:ABC transporter permease [Lachnospiraceae bacterium]